MTKTPPVTPAPAKAKAVLVFAPGIGHGPGNSAERVAEVIARSLDRRRSGSYRADDSAATAPRGLRVGKTVVGPGDEPLVEVLELDYRHRLEDLDPVGATTVPPGIRVAAWDSVRSIIMLRHAWRSPCKRRLAKAQLLLGFATTGAVLLVGLLALAAALDAAGVGWAKHVVPGKHGAAKAAATGAGLTVAGVWAKGRQGLLTFRTQLHRVLRYFDDERHRDTVTQTLDDAIDGLLDSGWTAPVHLLGYSFGSLVVFDALFPRAAPSGPDRVGPAVSSLATIGFPLDAVAMYVPEHVAPRKPRAPGLPWRNVFIPADVAGSNLVKNADDKPDANATLTWAADTVVDSRRYTDERLHWYSVLRGKGFLAHAGYWGGADEASCFDLLIDMWIPAAP